MTIGALGAETGQSFGRVRQLPGPTASDRPLLAESSTTALPYLRVCANTPGISLSAHLSRQSEDPPER